MYTQGHGQAQRRIGAAGNPSAPAHQQVEPSQHEDEDEGSSHVQLFKHSGIQLMEQHCSRPLQDAPDVNPQLCCKAQGRVEWGPGSY
jgi:hypothetical protein